MPRAMRVEYPGAIYHVMDRGDRREDIFVDDVDRQDFLKTLAEAGQKTGWHIHAYCLMGNHFHLVLETPNANLVASMRWFLSAYTIRFGEHHSGELHRETAEQRANRILSEELSRRGWEESDSATRRRSDPGKVAIAARLRKETILPIKWIAARVQIGTAKGAKSVLHHLAHRQHPGNAAAGLKPCTQLEFQSTVRHLSLGVAI